ncbi:MAG: hypothetical protein A2174_02330 [Candidatus Portnoybacteria bacterium RBG_13_41_18]|uniref:Methyltransferase type 11 domain-containing protein n=1 Tax=Candidatus Portnoybacteria bacterium RBG_13_41_18 TaxID=1801991 RepID=A0A1G2F9L8_9BACT|nr:MAG: hypothetical protein A2174_02330 [Candidatus Portnoybacteria bacterium RBG_13_41_18]
MSDEKNVQAQELWDLCRKEYESSNPIKRLLFKKYFGRLGNFFKLLKKNDKVLEIGCGAGESSMRIKKFLPPGVHFEASDVEVSYILMIREKGMPFTVSQESVYHLQRKDGDFDCVIMLSVLEHLDNPDAALGELFRVSRKYVILSVPNEPLWSFLNLARFHFLKDWGNTPGHINHWSKVSIAGLVNKFGSVVTVKRSLPWLIILAEVKK